MSMKFVITDNIVEKLELDIDEERSSLIQTTKGAFPEWPSWRVIILNPDEARQITAHILNFYKPDILVKHPDQSLPDNDWANEDMKRGWSICQKDMLKHGWVRVIQIGGNK